MIKINALDFLKNEKFGVDVFSETGDILYDAESAVTPEILLTLYFKNVFIKEPLVIVSEPIEGADLNGDLGEQVAETTPVIIEKIAFDEAMATRVVEHCLMMAAMLDLDEDTVSTLKKAAYYHNIGCIEMTTDLIEDPDFKKKRAQLSYTYMLDKLDMPEKVARVAKSYLTGYDPIKYELKQKNKSNIPIHQIVAIASYYEEFLEQTSSEEEALVKMLRLGGNKFNIYLLHKFVHKMRKINA